MSYDERETSVYGGEPVECYAFSRSGTEWLLTSADRAIEIPGIGTFEPEPVLAGGQEFRDEEEQSEVEVELPRTSPIIAPYIPGLPAEPTAIAIYRTHRDDEANYICWFRGKVASVKFKADSVAVATCATIFRQLAKRIPGYAWTASCNWALYSTECGLNAEDYRDAATIDTVSGVTVTSAAFALRADGYFTGGWLQRSDGDRRFIVAHTGSSVQLIYPMSGLAVGESVSAYRGCDHSRAACLAFGNRMHFTGFEWIPRRDPHTQRMLN